MNKHNTAGAQSWALAKHPLKRNKTMNNEIVIKNGKDVHERISVVKIVNDKLGKGGNK